MTTNQQRQEAAREWLEDYAEHCRTFNATAKTGKMEKALAVLVLTHATSDWLAEHDPQALQQAQEALSGKSWRDFVNI